MFVVGLLSWWYGEGWRQCVAGVRDRIVSLYDYFSFDLLLTTLFAPFRQISAGNVRGSLSVQMHAWLDRLVSRVVGAVVRSGLLLIGLAALCLVVLWGAVSIVLWAIVPVVPIIGVVLMVIGWVPWRV